MKTGIMTLWCNNVAVLSGMTLVQGRGVLQHSAACRNLCFRYHCTVYKNELQGLILNFYKKIQDRARNDTFRARSNFVERI